MRLIDTDVIFLLHTLDQLFDEFVETSIHLHLLQALPHFFVQQIAVEQSLLNRLAEIVERLFARRQIVKHVILESALEQIIRKCAEQVLHAHFPSGIGDVFGVADALHNTAVSFQSSAFSKINR